MIRPVIAAVIAALFHCCHQGGASLLCEKTVGDGCHCFSKNVSHGFDRHVTVETTCCCQGYGVHQVPKNLSSDVKHLYMKHVGILAIEEKDFDNYPSLEIIDIFEAPHLKSIRAESFQHLEHLKKLSIKKCYSLRYVDGALQMNNSRLLILSFSHNSLHDLPSIITTKDSLNLPTIDFSFNEIRLLKTDSLKDVEAHSFDLSHNKIDVIEDYALTNVQLGVLVLDHNPLRSLAPRAFANTTTLRNLSLSHSEMSQLPEIGLDRVRKIMLVNNPNLKQLPSIFVFSSLQEAHMTYPYHCCLFKHAKVAKPIEQGVYKGNFDELSKKYCNQDKSSLPTVSTSSSDNYMTRSKNRRKKREILTTTTYNWDDFKEEDEKQISWDDFEEDKPNAAGEWGSYEDLEQAEANAESSTSDWPVDDDLKHHGRWIPTAVTIQGGQIFSFCNSSGFIDVGEYYSKITCYPTPDPLNPCEDVIGFVWLRIPIWFVWMMSILGNVMVIIILCATSQSRLRVNHFLMMNLAFADFCTGVYMAMLAMQDARTAGSYYNFAVDWQTGWGCNAAGFLAVFASELSIFTMVMISFEVWFNTKYIFYGSRLKLWATAIIMACGWMFAICIALLPLLGVFSSYSATSTCLPLGIESAGDKAYLLTVLSINILAFTYIVINYFSVYCMVAGKHAPSAQTQDMAIAKRMAILISTDFICWAPTILFGMTAAANFPLISVSVAKIFLVLFYPLNAFANPFLYVFLTKMVRKDMSRLARKHPWMKKVSVWRKSTTGSLWSSYTSSRNNSRATTAAKNASVTLTMTSWVSNNSIEHSMSAKRSVGDRPKAHDARSASVYEDAVRKCNTMVDQNQEGNPTITVTNASALGAGKRRRSSKNLKPRFSQNVEYYPINPNAAPKDHTASEERRPSNRLQTSFANVLKRFDDSYWYRPAKRLSQKTSSNDVDKSLLGESDRSESSKDEASIVNL